MQYVMFGRTGMEVSRFRLGAMTFTNTLEESEAARAQVGEQRGVRAIRNPISSGKLVVSTTVRDRTTGRLTTSENRVAGPTIVFCTSTDPQIDPETRSRFFVIGIAESNQQTLDVLAWQRQKQTLEGLSAEQHVTAIRARHHRFQRLLRPLRVVNPLALSLCCDESRLQAH